MDRQFDTRLRDMLAQAEVSPELIDGLLPRLETETGTRWTAIPCLRNCT